MKEVEKMKMETRIAGTPPEPKKSDETKKIYRKENRKVIRERKSKKRWRKQREKLKSKFIWKIFDICLIHLERKHRFEKNCCVDNIFLSGLFQFGIWRKYVDSLSAFINFSCSTASPKSNVSKAIMSILDSLLCWYIQHALYSMTKNIVTGMIWNSPVHSLMYATSVIST